MNLKTYFSHWQQIHQGLLALIEDFSPGELAYMPFAGSWTVKEIILHIADTEEGWIHYLLRRKYDAWPEGYDPQDFPDSPALITLLTEIHDRTMSYLATCPVDDLEKGIKTDWGSQLTLGWVVWHVLEHEIHHRGELSLILGMLGREGLDV